ncbi:DUF4224 domain-containing protein [[Enterobacter] lignolyticus]|uniref:DUF4224 domain-containing protein n=1 Tax=Enterobacter lignolyticus (strain SCF1) TaxID=701347 RepID=E3G2Q7_ENTLS|nr:DUF4224 domain-containing protein [[Enterobacter] lignolyticus]ADO48088.1 hypothetical protein Entcl_1832 [[Enterobacter] lignolyticus SCF1]
MSDNILSPADLVALTKYKQPKKQCAWLASAGIWFERGRDGHPSTTWHHVNNPLTLRFAKQIDPALSEPNFDAM